MRSLVSLPVVAAVVVLSAAPALADPPAPALPPLPSALAAELSPAESSTLATLTAGSGVGVDAFVQTSAGASVVTLDSSTRSAATQAVALLDGQPGVTAGLTAPVQAVGEPTATATSRATSADAVQWDIARVHGTAAAAEVPASARNAVTVAVLDTGIAAHALLDAALVPGQNFSASDPADPTDIVDRYGHGTHVAGTVAAAVGTVRGVAPGVRLMPVKVLGDSGNGTSAAIAGGVAWATDHGADVVTMSIGSSYDDPAEQQAIDYARSHGVVVVAAVGNYAQQGNYLSYPGADQGVVGVAATDSGDAWATFSEHGPQVDVAAPGVDVESTYLGGGFATMSGTSMATPHVAAAAALVKAVDRALTPDQVQSVLEQTAEDLGATGRDEYFGSGELDAQAAVDAAYAAAGLTAPDSPPVAAVDHVTVPVIAGVAPPVLVDVLANDTDPDGGPLVLAAVGAAGQGATQVTSDQKVRYTPRFGAQGVDSFSYRVSDDRGVSATGTVQVTFAHVTTDIDRLYAQLGGSSGALGGVVTPEHGIRGGSEADYARGVILLASGSAPHAVTGAILASYAATGGAAGGLGYPTTDAFGPLRGGGWGQHFQGGSIYWSPTTGAHTLTGALRGEYAATGWENGLGYPTTDAFGPLRGGGWGQHFQGGSIYWSPTTGAHTLTGALRGEYAATGWENGLGYAVTEPVCGLRGGGCLQHFQLGSIYWSPGSGAHTVRAPFRDQWGRVGWEKGRLGYPTSEIYPVRGGLAQRFQHGTITWTQRSKRTTVAYRR